MGRRARRFSGKPQTPKAAQLCFFWFPFTNKTNGFPFGFQQTDGGYKLRKRFPLPTNRWGYQLRKRCSFWNPRQRGFQKGVGFPFTNQQTNEGRTPEKFLSISLQQKHGPPNVFGFPFGLQKVGGYKLRKSFPFNQLQGVQRPEIRRLFSTRVVFFFTLPFSGVFFFPYGLCTGEPRKQALGTNDMRKELRRRQKNTGRNWDRSAGEGPFHLEVNPNLPVWSVLFLGVARFMLLLSGNQKEHHQFGGQSHNADCSLEKN